jgi:hypothetical protein
MELTLQTNRLAIASFVSGLIAMPGLLATFVVLLYPGYLPEPGSPFNTFMDLSRSVRDLGTIAALVTGVLALREIRKKGGTEKSKILAWAGIILGGGWTLFRVAVAIFFILALVFSGR